MRKGERLRPMQPGRQLSPPEETGGLGRRRALGCLTLAFLVPGLLLYYSFRQAVESVEVAGFEWRRNVEVEAWSTVRDEAWEEDVPPNAKRLASRREVHHTEPAQVATERVRVGTRDTGNGTLEDVYEDSPVYGDRPVYRTKYTYEIERWAAARTARAEGRDRSPHWPETGLGAGEREGQRLEVYAVLLRGRREYRKELSQDRWAALQLGQRLTATVRGDTVERLE